MLPQLPEGCELPASNVIPVPEDQFVWEEVGQTCTDSCGSAMVDSDEALVCFCDSSCVLTFDCCPDFLEVCPVDPCILALVMPQDAPEPIGTCPVKIPKAFARMVPFCIFSCFPSLFPHARTHTMHPTPSKFSSQLQLLNSGSQAAASQVAVKCTAY